MLKALPARIAGFFAADDPWIRPAPAPGDRSDRIVAVGWLVFILASLELFRGIGVLDRDGITWPVAFVISALVPLALVWRRRYPLTVLALTQLHMIVVGIAMPLLMGQFAAQMAYFFAIFSGVAWARDRRALLLVVGIDLLVMFGWLALWFAVGSGIDSQLDGINPDRVSHGGLGPAASAVILGMLTNTCFFGGALIWGQSSWRHARHTALLAQQATTIAEQSDELREAAVVDERMRIARELHDVVAHHVSVMGVQAAGARRVMASDPSAAAGALQSVEASARAAVEEMRRLLLTLRSRNASTPTAPDSAASPGSAPAEASRSPEPGLRDLPDLAAAATTTSLRTSYDLVGDIDRVPAPMGLSLYRIVQEALTNIRKHSTARTAHVATRVTDAFVEVEVVDDGRPLPGTSGSGLGLLGMRERIVGHNGQIEAGPRVVGGYRVRVRLPLDERR